MKSLQALTQTPGNSLDPYYIFLAPPSLETLRKRLYERNTETPDQIERRLANAEGEVAFGKSEESNFDFRLVNEDLETTVGGLAEILRECYPHLQGAGGRWHDSNF